MKNPFDPENREQFAVYPSESAVMELAHSVSAIVRVDVNEVYAWLLNFDPEDLSHCTPEGLADEWNDWTTGCMFASPVDLLAPVN